MTEAQQTRIEELRLASKKVEYYQNPTMKQKDVVFFLVDVLPFTRSLALPELVKKDLQDYPIFTAIGLWCDPNYGIGKEFPAEVIQITDELFSRFGPKPPQKEVKVSEV